MTFSIANAYSGKTYNVSASADHVVAWATVGGRRSANVFARRVRERLDQLDVGEETRMIRGLVVTRTS